MKIIDTMRRLARWIEGPIKFKPPKRFNPKDDVRLAVLADRRLLLDRKNTDYPFSANPFDWPPRYMLNILLLMPTFPYEADVVMIDSLRSPDDYKRLENHNCVIVHIDLSVRPDLVNEIINRLPPRVRILNRRVTDIRKREMGEIVKRFGFATPEIDANADPETPVFIKSNWNAGDTPKQVYEYRTLRDVPPKVWQNPDLIVQRFIEERVLGVPGCRRLRRFLIVAGEMVQQEYLSMEPTLKGSTCLCWQYSRDIRCMPRDVELVGWEGARTLGFYYYDVDEKTRLIADRIKSFAENIGLDFGAIDTISPDPEHTYILDVNTTPLQRALTPAIKEILTNALAIHISRQKAV